MEYLPVETLLHIFRYIPSQPASFVDGKTDIYHTALTCRTFYQLSMPILWADFSLTLNPRDNYRRPYQERFLETLTLDSAKNFVLYEGATFTFQPRRVDSVRTQSMHVDQNRHRQFCQSL
jgi:hypothetical protein